MFNKLKEAEERFLQLEGELANPETVSNQQEFTKLMKEYKNLTPVIEKYREYKKTQSDLEGARALMEEESGEMYDLALEEYKECKDRIDAIEEELKFLLIPKDPNDDKNVVVEIRAGAGGEEAALFAYDLYRMYSMYSQANGFKFELTGANETGLKGFKEVTFMISGEGAYSRFKFESGVHRVQRVPETESQGRIHTSTASVAVLPEQEDVDIEINEKDIRLDIYRSSGAGGQHVNTTDSAIRITHIPTGIVVTCQDERSQIKNKEKAFAVLRSKLYDLYKTQSDEDYARNRKNQVGTGDRSERIRTYNYPQGRLTDHRINYTVYNLDAFLNGDLDDLIENLTIAHQEELLQSSQE